MKKLKLWSIMMFVIMVLFMVVACGSSDDNDEEGGEKGGITTTAVMTDDGYYDGLLYYKITSNSPYEVMVYKAEKKYATQVEIPTYVKIDETTYKCTSIGERVFYGSKNLTSITIPNSVRNIGKLAFYYCDGLKKVIVKDIAAWCRIVFEDGTSNPLLYAHHLYSDENKEISEIVIPNNVTSIGKYVFYRCLGLTSIIIPNSVTTIGDEAFFLCSNLTSVTIPNSMNTIGESAFAGCSNLTSVTIPNSMNTIGESAFVGCSNLTSVKCLAQTPPEIKRNYYGNYVVFDSSICNTAFLYIPMGTLDAYKKADGWKSFKNIVEE